MPQNSIDQRSRSISQQIDDAEKMLRGSHYGNRKVDRKYVPKNINIIWLRIDLQGDRPQRMISTQRKEKGKNQNA